MTSCFDLVLFIFGSPFLQGRKKRIKRDLSSLGSSRNRGINRTEGRIYAAKVLDDELSYNGLASSPPQRDDPLKVSLPAQWRTTVLLGIEGVTPLTKLAKLASVAEWLSLAEACPPVIITYIDHNMINDKSNTLYLGKVCCFCLPSWICSKSLSGALPILV